MRNLTAAGIAFGVALAFGCRENTQVSSNDPVPGSAPVKVSRADDPDAEPEAATRTYPEGKWIEGLESPDSLTLYSLEPFEPSIQGKEATPGVERLGGWRVLGKVEIDDAREREKIVAALQEAVNRPNTRQTKCFYPRHAVVGTEAGKDIEIVICFACGNYSVNGEGLTLAIGDQPKPLLNNILTKANIELAKE